MNSKSNYYIYTVLLEGCPYSNKAIDLLKKNNINHQVKIVTYENKEKFKMENYSTYPQIFLKKEASTDSLFLGGYSDLENFINTFKDNKYDENNISQFKNKYNWWSRKATLRLIQLIN
jgi:glutaredoxin